MPSNSILTDLPKQKLKTYVYKMTCTSMFITALPTISENCKQLKCHQ